MALIGHLVKNATAPVTGEVHKFESPKKDITWYSVDTAAQTSGVPAGGYTVQLHGTIDQVNWFSLGTIGPKDLGSTIASRPNLLVTSVPVLAIRADVTEIQTVYIDPSTGAHRPMTPAVVTVEFATPA